jgi:hypothetical protein
MKKKSWLGLGLAIAGALVLVCGLAGLALYLYLTNLPPSPLDSSGYYVRGGKVYYNRGFPDGSFVIATADAGTFKDIGSGYARDQRQVYFRGSRILGADVPSFVLLPAADASKDKNHVYQGIEVVSDDPAHYEFLGGPLTKDSQHVYWSNKIISDDPAHFVIIKASGVYSYDRDSQTVFVQGNPIAGADPATFTVIQEDYARDQGHIYYFDQVIMGAHLATFQVLASPYARDAQSVFWMEHLIPGADPQTFKILNLAFQCTADQKQAYYQNQVIANADPKTFPPGKTVNNCSATDIFFSP